MSVKLSIKFAAGACLADGQFLRGAENRFKLVVVVVVVVVVSCIFFLL